MNTKNLQQLLDNFQGARRDASAASKRLAEIHRLAQELTRQVDGRLVPASLGDVARQLDAFMRRVKADGDWFKQAAALRDDLSVAQATARRAGEAARKAEAALAQEANRLNDERAQTLRTERAKAVKRLVKFLLPYCNGEEPKANELACLCPAVTGLDFKISTAVVPVAPEIMAGRFLSTVN
jgi:hypothetical protein